MRNDLGRKNFVERGHFRQQIAHRRPKKFLIEIARRRVNRRNAQIRLLVLVEHFIRMHLNRQQIAVRVRLGDLALDEKFHSVLERLQQIFLIEPSQLHVIKIVAEQGVDDDESLASVARRDIGQVPDDRGDFADDQIVDCGQGALVFVAARVMREEIVKSTDAELFKRRRAFRTDAFQIHYIIGELEFIIAHAFAPFDSREFDRRRRS